MERGATWDDSGARRRPTVLIAAAVLLAVGLTGCTQASSDAGFGTWYEQTRTVLGDTNGVGGGGGATPGSVEIGSMRRGSWIVYAVCNNTDILHIRIRGAGKTLTESDLLCGATIALPVTVGTAGARDFEIDTRHPKGSSGPGWWSAQVNSTAWHEARSFGFN